MADNVIANPGAGGATFATDNIGGVQYPRSKVVFGPDGTATDVDVAAGAALPVQLRNSGGTEIGTAGAPVRTDPTNATTQNVDVTDEDGRILGRVKVLDSAAAVIDPALKGQLPAALVGGRLDVNIGAAGATVTVDTELPAAAALADATANPTAPIVGACNEVFNGATWDRARGDTANGLDVDVTRLPTIAQLPAALVGGRLDVNIGAAGATVTVDTELPAAAALADATANPTSPLVGACLELWNTATWDRARGDTANGLDVDVTRLPSLVAGSAVVGIVGRVNGTIYTSGGTAWTVKTKFAAPASSGNNAFISAVSSKKLRLLGYCIQASGTVSVKFTDTAGSPADLGPAWSLQAREGVQRVAPEAGFIFETAAGLGIQVNLSGAVACNVEVTYAEEP